MLGIYLLCSFLFVFVSFCSYLFCIFYCVLLRLKGYVVFYFTKVELQKN